MSDCFQLGDIVKHTWFPNHPVRVEEITRDTTDGQWFRGSFVLPGPSPDDLNAAGWSGGEFLGAMCVLLKRPGGTPTPTAAPPAKTGLRPSEAPDKGRKDDSGKLRYDLVPERAEREIVEVLTFGAAKYAPDNWRKVPDARNRYYAALRRHVAAWRLGERSDPETGLSHLAHAACCLLFLAELDQGT